MRESFCLAGIDLVIQERSGNSVVVDVGGTTMNVGVLLQSGLPWQAV